MKEIATTKNTVKRRSARGEGETQREAEKTRENERRRQAMKAEKRESLTESPAFALMPDAVFLFLVLGLDLFMTIPCRHPFVYNCQHQHQQHQQHFVYQHTYLNVHSSLPDLTSSFPSSFLPSPSLPLPLLLSLPDKSSQINISTRFWIKLRGHSCRPRRCWSGWSELQQQRGSCNSSSSSSDSRSGRRIDQLHWKQQQAQHKQDNTPVSSSSSRSSSVDSRLH